MPQSFLDPDKYKWREVTGDPVLSYMVHHDYTILGYDLAAGTLDMLVRWEGDGGHCPIHRHRNPQRGPPDRLFPNHPAEIPDSQNGDEWLH